MKAGIKVMSSDAASGFVCCTNSTAMCSGSWCMAWIDVGGFKCSVCEGINIDQIECCGDTMDRNTEGSCGMVGP